MLWTPFAKEASPKRHSELNTADIGNIGDTDRRLPSEQTTHIIVAFGSASLKAALCNK